MHNQSTQAGGAGGNFTAGSTGQGLQGTLGFGGVPLKVQFQGGQGAGAGGMGSAAAGAAGMGGTAGGAARMATGAAGATGFGGVGLTAGAYQSPTSGLLAGTSGGGFATGQLSGAGAFGGAGAGYGAGAGSLGAGFGTGAVASTGAVSGGLTAGYGAAQSYAEGSPTYRQYRNQENHQAAVQSGLTQLGAAGGSAGSLTQGMG